MSSSAPTTARQGHGRGSLPPHAPPPLLFRIKVNSLEDGPGIRSVVFLKDCPLSCIWCHNPEGRRREAELWWEPERCLRDGSCMAVCNAGAISPAHPEFIDRARCSGCLACADACPTQALSRVGAECSVDEIVRQVSRYRPFYKRSNGGVTLSGGEPMLHMEFSEELLARLREEGIHTLVQTSGLFPLDPFLARILPNANRIHFDIKLVDPELHRRYCGVDNARILSNFERILEQAKPSATECLPSTPLIPGITDTDTNVLTLARLYSRLGVPRVILHLNNPAWLPKCVSLGARPSDALGPRIGSLYEARKASEIKQVFLEHGIRVSFQ